MRSRLILIILIALVALSTVNARDDIIFKLNQTEYYFLVGQNAVVSLEVVNEYDQNIAGTFTYTITQSISKQGFSYKNTNTQSRPFEIAADDAVMGLNFGSSNEPSTLEIDIKFTYSTKEDYEVKIDNLIVHFVQNQDEQKNKQNQQSSKSEKVKQQEQSQQEQQQQQSQAQQKQNQLQNNQQNQDSSALKQQIQDQINQEKQVNEQFQKELAKNQEFQQMHQQMLKQGYNVSDAKFDPDSNNTGDFEIDYKDKDGNEGKVQGRMNNGTIDNLQKLDEQAKQNMMQQMQNNSDFQKFNDELNNLGYNQTNIEFSIKDNKTIAQITYNDGLENKTAEIIAEFVNQTIEDVKLEAEFDKSRKNLVLSILFLVLAAAGFFIYKQFHKKQTADKTIIKKQKSFNYKLESKKLLDLAKKQFDDKLYKDAYGNAAASVRMFISYKHELNKEITNNDLIKFLRKNKLDHKDIKECFDISSLVEFARYKVNKHDFDKIAAIAEKIVDAKK